MGTIDRHYRDLDTTPCDPRRARLIADLDRAYADGVPPARIDAAIQQALAQRTLAAATALRPSSSAWWRLVLLPRVIVLSMATGLLVMLIAVALGARGHSTILPVQVATQSATPTILGTVHPVFSSHPPGEAAAMPRSSLTVTPTQMPGVASPAIPRPTATL